MPVRRKEVYDMIVRKIWVVPAGNPYWTRNAIGRIVGKAKKIKEKGAET